MHARELKTLFIIHTGYDEQGVMTEAERMRVFAFLDKPWDERRLISTVQEALQTGEKLRN